MLLTRLTVLLKKNSYEGGVRTPMIAYWPKGIAGKKGAISNSLGHVMDFMPTFLQLANATYPTTYKGNTIKPMQGISFKDVFDGKITAGHDMLFNEHFGNKYARLWRVETGVPEK